LYRRDGIQQKSLAKILDIAPISLTRQLDRLEKDSWIERRDDPTDRRAKNIYLMPKTLPILKKLTKLGQQLQEVALRGIEPDDRDKLLTMLIKMRENLADSS
jgi:DNA-binding MarR family transcriptional regulator